MATRSPTGRGWALATTTARIEDAAATHEALVDALLDVAAAERTLRHLAEEVAETTRRINALEHVVLPRLQAERDAIALVLDEREREDGARRLRAKRRGAGR